MYTYLVGALMDIYVRMSYDFTEEIQIATKCFSKSVCAFK